MDTTGTPSQDIQREYLRVDAQIPLAVRRVPASEVRPRRARLAGEAFLSEWHTVPEVEDKRLNDWLVMLDAKLNAIISMLSFQDQGFHALPVCAVNISGGGMGFATAEAYSPGETLELKLILPFTPPVGLYVYGQVVKSEPAAEGHLTAIQYQNMDEEIRDDIVRYVFERERELLRAKRR
ncbi:MAG: PilZ domain-containing protein [Thermodesulfobacteriota bacterium]